MADYKVRFEVFEGPLDLLLYLVKKEEVDIYEVNLSTLATQFLEYLDLMRQLDLDVAGEFIVMAATLLYIKSRELLPVDQQVAVEGEEEGPDPRWDLIRQLVEYKKFKDAAARFQELEQLQESIYPHQPPAEHPLPPTSFPSPQVSLFDLLSAIQQVLKRLSERQPPEEIVDDRWTVAGQMEHILRVLLEQPRITFRALFDTMAHRAEVVTTFLALLELIRLQQVVAHQEETFGEILLTRRRPNTETASAIPVSAGGATSGAFLS
ncbi:MAG: segregation/condensation protein A [Verrucomicrobiota bacterium]|nr:segregation/condensation protein A [Limisphaera sp.]MDW8381756.1 segregation/condensation protein A [Verrucomicrobiota bacterium]